MSEIDILNNGFPVTIPYRKNLEKACNMGTMFAQDIEPAGDYINYHDPAWGTNLPNHVYGNITFYNPLIIEWETTCHGGWKTKLSKQFGGKTKKALTNAIVKAGYDAVITIDSESGTFMEIVNINGVKS
jgi:hypothetical protein